MRSLSLLLLVTLAALGEKAVSQQHRRAKRESLSRSKRRWVLSTIVVDEEMNVDYPFKISTMYNDQTAGKQYEFVMDGEGVPAGLFSIDKTSGDVFVHKKLDREEKASYHITFDVWDVSKSMKIDRQLAFDVDIKDINDNAPQFINLIKQAHVKENTKSGEYLPVSVEATDRDQEKTINSTVVIKVGKQSPAEPKIGIKDVDGTKHQFTTEGCFNYDTAKQYSLDIIASDLGKPPLSTTSTVTLNIIDTNTHQPTFKKRQYQAEAVERQTSEDILRVAVEDKDTPNTDGWRAQYFFISGNEDGIYKITTDPKTNEGVIGVVKEKNFDITTLVKLQIGVKNIEDLAVCKDGKLITNRSMLPPPDSIEISVKMVDTNDPPVFDKYNEEIYQREESEPGQVLYTPKVHDDDSPNIRYELLQNPANWVTIDTKTGQIKSLQRMDRESPFVDENNIYKIVIAAIDDGEPPATSTCTINIHLGDINDNTPKLLNMTVVLCTNLADKVMVSAKDADEDPFSGPFNFFLADDKTVSEHWKLDPAHGEEVGIVFLKTLRRGNYSVPIVIQDQQNEAMEERLNVMVCECVKNGVCGAPKPLSTGLGTAAIGLIIAGLLLFLILLASLGWGQKPVLIDSHEGIQSLMNYNQEGGGADCRVSGCADCRETLCTTPQVDSTYIKSCAGECTTDSFTEGNMQITSNMSRREYQQSCSLYRNNMASSKDTEEFPELNNSNANWNRTSSKITSNMSSREYQQQSAFHRNNMASSKRYSSYSGSVYAWEDPRFRSLLKQNLAKNNDQDKDPISNGIDCIKMYQEEGENRLWQSVDQLHIEVDDLSFLDNLGPQFSPLAKIINESMRQGSQSCERKEIIHPK